MIGVVGTCRQSSVGGCAEKVTLALLVGNVNFPTQEPEFLSKICVCPLMTNGSSIEDHLGTGETFFLLPQRLLALQMPPLSVL